MQNTLEILAEELKGKPCQWLISGAGAFIRFNAELKSISDCTMFDSISIKFKVKGSMSASLEKPITIHKEDNDKAMKYTVYSNDGKQCMIVGYLKN